MPSPFEYAPLSIRVIEILPARFKFQPLRIQLSEVDIDYASPYKALSYVWVGNFRTDESCAAESLSR